jgi:hypothetical protein
MQLCKSPLVARQFDGGRSTSRTQIRRIRGLGTRREKFSVLPEQQHICGLGCSSFGPKDAT